VAEQKKASKILIAVPTTGGTIKAKTAESLIKLMKVLIRSGIDADIYNIDNSDIVTARNRYANLVLESDHWDSLLFIDSDMQFKPKAILRMIALNVPVAAAACTTREFDVEKFAGAIQEHGDIERARAEASRFNVLRHWGKGGAVKTRGQFYAFAAVGMAVCLIKKSALEDMIEAGVVEQRVDRFGKGVEMKSWGFFDLVKVKETAFSEDFSFCHRWSARMNRPLWVCVDEEIGHIGEFPYSASFLTTLNVKPVTRPEAVEDRSAAE
jgi:hypothetical protein